MSKAFVTVLLTGTLTLAQQIGNLSPEKHPTMTTQTCTKSGGCQTQQNAVTIDSNWRWTHQVGKPTNCYTGNQWNTMLCPDGPTCASNCAIDGADYEATYGISASGNALKLGFVTHGQYSTNIGSRTYLMQDDDNYQMFKLKNKEFTFDVDVSNLPCGLNGALYFVSMDQDGGKSKFSGNKAGARYGTGYCDAQCPHDLKFINGEANCEGWQPSPNDKNAGSGKYGTCCPEMDIWEANIISTAYTPHPCSVSSQTRCEGIQCGDNAKGQRYDGVCDKDGCDSNPFRLGDKDFYGAGKTVDSSKPFTVVTQFITDDGTDTGSLKEIRRVWVQNGQVIGNPQVTIAGQSYDSISDEFCTAQKTWFNDTNSFNAKGGIAAMGKAMDNGMVLVMSLWDDHDVHMLWLDSNYPTTAPATQPGVARGTCSTSSGAPDDVEKNHPTASVTYSNIKFGEIGSTYPSGPPGPSPGPPSPGPPSPGPNGCPGGSLSACIGLCPSNPPAAYKACVAACVQRCPSAKAKA